MSPQLTTPKDTILIRRVRIWEGSQLGRIAAKTYMNSALIAYLDPDREEYYSHYERGFISRSWKRLLDPRNVTFVAVSSSQPSLPVAFVSIQRLGSDAGAQRQIASRKSLWLSLAAWLAFLWFWMMLKVVGDKSQDPAHQAAFEASNASTGRNHWEVEGRTERWHVQSCVVLESWQGRGVGKMLMAEVIALAERDGVVVGLEASPQGEQLYRRVGFELLARFPQAELDFGEDITNEGGVMMYTPVKMRKA
jgi:GNAT superfamily N-acetyltransferase